MTTKEKVIDFVAEYINEIEQEKAAKEAFKYGKKSEQIKEPKTSPFEEIHRLTQYLSEVSSQLERSKQEVARLEDTIRHTENDLKTRKDKLYMVLDAEIGQLNVDSLDITEMLCQIYDKFEIDLRVGGRTVDTKMQSDFLKLSLRHVIEHTFESMTPEEHAAIALRKNMNSLTVAKELRERTNEDFAAYREPNSSSLSKKAKEENSRVG